MRLNIINRLSVVEKLKNRSDHAEGARRKQPEPDIGGFSEVGRWRASHLASRRIYGGLGECGVSIEWHSFQMGRELEWSHAFHPGSLELCLNLSGSGAIASSEAETTVQPLSSAFYYSGTPSLKASRRAHERHRFATVVFSPAFLRTHLAHADGGLHPVAEAALNGRQASSSVSEAHELNTAHQQLVAYLLQPPVVQGGRKLWCQGKILELMSAFFFQRAGDDELFCDRQKRVARERVDRAIAILREHLAEPPSLAELGRRVGCSPFHLSRTFSKEMGITIPQFLRRIRMERAAELLAGGKCNVTEAALEVGYSSMSHFSQAFCETMGCCPNLYPHAKTLQQTFALGPSPLLG